MPKARGNFSKINSGVNLRTKFKGELTFSKFTVGHLSLSKGCRLRNHCRHLCAWDAGIYIYMYRYIYMYDIYIHIYTYT